MEQELLNALKKLTKECYNGKYQHSNLAMRNAMEKAESVINYYFSENVNDLQLNQKI